MICCQMAAWCSSFALSAAGVGRHALRCFQEHDPRIAKQHALSTGDLPTSQTAPVTEMLLQKQDEAFGSTGAPHEAIAAEPMPIRTWRDFVGPRVLLLLLLAVALAAAGNFAGPGVRIGSVPVFAVSRLSNQRR